MQTLLAIDYGTKRFGLAVGNTLTMTTQAISPIENLSNKVNWPALKNVLHEWKINAVVLGEPLDAQGNATAMSKTIRAFGEELRHETELPVAYADERYSSSAADRSLRSVQQQGKKLKKKQILMRDSLAAELILQAYFEQN